MTLLLLLVTWTTMVTTVLSECVTRLRRDGVGIIVGHRLFSNGSLGLVDDYARFVIYNSAGVQFYKENLNLPNDPDRSSMYRLSLAIITSSTNQLYVMSTNHYGFTILAGNIIATSYFEVYRRIFYWGIFLNFPNYGVGLNSMGMGLYMTNGNQMSYDSQLDTSLGSNRMFNNSYISRASVNPLLNEFYLTMFSNRTFIGGVNQAYRVFEPSGVSAASAVTTESSFNVITSSIGGNSQYIGFAGYYPWSASNKYSHYLRIKRRSPVASASLLITEYHIWSVALDSTTATKLYFLTHDGSLYSTTFSTSSISTPTLLMQDAFLKYANLEIMSSTKLLLRTMDSMAVFDITTSTINIAVNIKPTGARHFGSKMFVLTHNFNVSLYELSGDSPVKDNSFSYTGKVSELIVNIISNRFYILTTTALYTYSLSNYTQLASLTMTQIKSMISASSIISLNDISSLVLQPTKLMLLAYGTFSGNQDTAMLVVWDKNLTYVNHYLTGLLDNFLTLSVGDGFSGYDHISLSRPDCINVFHYTTSDSFTNPNVKTITKYIAPADRPEIANMKDVLFLSIPAGDKQLPRSDLQSGFVYQAQVEAKRIIATSRSSSTFNMQSFNRLYIPNVMMVQRLDGHLNKTMVFSAPLGIFILYPNLNTNHNLLSEDFLGGIIYQKSDDSFVFFNGDFEVSKIVDLIECYADPTKGYQRFLYPCNVANCEYCSAFYPNKCSICDAGMIISQDRSACLSTCNPGYLLNGMCYNNCPIEYYKYNAAINTCETPTGCSVTRNKLILGDRCNSVSSCPSGSTPNSSKYCTFSSTSAANPTSTAIVANPCTGGQLYWPHYSMCVNPGNSSYAGYTVSGGVMYCDASTHFYDVASKRCLRTCGLYSGVHPQMGLICVSAANCNSVGMFTDVTIGGVKLCTSTCNSTLWTNQVAKSCVTSCPYPSTYSQLNNRTCLLSCGASFYTLETNKSCLTSSECQAAALLKTPSAMICTTTCGASLYLNSPTNECLTSIQCISSSRLLSTVDMKCVAACSASQYLLAVTKQCLTATQCKAVNSASGGGLLSEDDKNCVASCSPTQYILNSASQCLGPVLCKAVPPINGGGLLSEGNKKCVSTCNSSQFLLTANSQCLTEAACLATSGYAKLSMYDRKCVSSCGTTPQQYLAITTSKCWLAAECVNSTQGNGIIDNVLLTCDNSCSTGLYRLEVSSECLTAAACKAKSSGQGGGLLSEENMLCVNACTASQYYLAASSECLSSELCQAAFGNAGFLDEVNKNCVPSCALSEYELTSSRQCLSDTQCLAAYNGAGLLSEADNLCVSSCSSTQYLLESSMQCLTASECLATNSGVGLLSMQDKRCVTSCSATQYLDQPSSSCLSSTECNARYSGAGLTNTRDKTCVSSCPSDLYHLATTQQCLTAVDCHMSAGNTGLISNSDKKCLTSCQSSQYLLDASKECLTAAECRALSGNTGLLSESDMKCLVSCHPTQYLLESTQQCLTGSECLDSAPAGGFVSDSDKKCLDVCGPTQYLFELLSSCVEESICWGMNYLAATSSKLCQPSCLSDEYKDENNHYCYTKTECLSLTMLTKSSTPTNLCVSSCSFLDYLDDDQRCCLTKSECMTEKGGFIVGSNMTCVPLCPNNLHLVVDHECFESCPINYFLEESLPSCVRQCAESVSLVNNTYCLRYLDFRIIGAEQTDHDSVVVILEVYFESNPTTTVTSFSVELATLFKHVGIVTDTSTNTMVDVTELQKISQNDGQIELEFVSPVELKNPFHVRVLPESNIEFVVNQFRTSFHQRPRTQIISVIPPKISGHLVEYNKDGFLFNTGKVIAQILAATKILTPLMISTFMEVRSGSLLCLVAQTYTKLMMLTHMNFKLDYNEYSVMYYDIFKEFLDAFNEEFTKGVVGENIVEKNKQYVCDKGYEKLCFLTVEDNFFMSHMISLIIIAGQALVVFVLYQVFKLLKYKSISDLLLFKLKDAMLYAFILENSIEFWFTLLLNALIFVYRIAVLIVMKLCGHLLLGVMLFFLYKLITFGTNSNFKIVANMSSTKLGVGLTSSRMQKIREVLFMRLRAIIKEITTEYKASIFLKCYLFHDLAFAVVLVPGRFLGNFQMIIWMLIEVSLLFLVSRYRPFSTRVLNVRQITVEFLFLILLILMTIVPYNRSNNQFYSLTILLFSMFILVIDLFFVISEFVKTFVSMVKYHLKRKKSAQQSPYAKFSIMRADSADGLRTMRTTSKEGNEHQELSESKMISMRMISARGNITARGPNELTSQQKPVPRNRIIPSMYPINNRTSSLLNTAKPQTHLAEPETGQGEASSVIKPLKNSFFRRSSRMITLPPKVETSNIHGSLRHIDNFNTIRVRAPTLRRQSLANLNQLPDPKIMSPNKFLD